ncbi:FAD-binding domain containing protein [Grosmannia clavigera kw1407]|uniref:FAD-binding domain containing protein n=1 Tax=Grosmannia clavigera (strain kw1407 / UAMH 11150) TaxID=655863 RepID=F0XPH0_GROCL|nr:FAD-binding domain containing protein [Grosmannia clavigera kw1407]EFX00609.1 FAD-binding domain containing protein [Grosmannia clavigera kw1407]
MAAPESTSRLFRAIIAGGSIVGLTMALALDRADIDYVLLETGEVAPDLGASVSMHAHTQRVMEQLAVWPEIDAAVVPVTDREHYDEHGWLFEKSAILQEISKMCLGRQTSFMARRFWLQCLYNQIRDKNKVRAHTGLVSFVETADDVTVTTTGGEIITGDVLIGADGIHSTVRQQLADEAAAAGKEAAATAMRSGFVSKYQCIFATAKNDEPQQFLLPGMVHNVYYRGFSGVISAGVPGFAFWFLFVKSDQASRTPDTPRFSDADVEAVIDRYGHHAVGPGYTFRDLWQATTKAAMLPLEEGVLATAWRSPGGRVVLAGDAVHKATINPGLGANLGVEGVVHLANLLVPLVRRVAVEPDDRNCHTRPTRLQLADVFSAYEKLQRPHADLVVSMSSYLTRFEAMETWWLRLLRRLSPWISDRTKASKFAGYVREGPWLSYLPNPDDERR